MANRNTIRVSEFEKLYYDDAEPFKKIHWESLCKYLEERNRKEKTRVEFYRILNKGIQFTNFVGVIQTRNLTIEILPKTDGHKTTAANLTIEELKKTGDEDFLRKQGWHEVLLQMLRECKLLRVNHVGHASLRLKSNSILDIYIELFIAETEKLLHEGLVKKYKKTEGNSFAMKGQLLFAKNINRNLVHQERFYIRYTEYNGENIYNQLLYKTLCLIPSLTDNSSLKDRINRLILDFPEMPDCKITAETFDKLIYERKTERYKEALLISKMLLLNYRPDISGGPENVMAILFDMNMLWEEFVYRRLAKTAKDDILVSRQNKKQFWYNRNDESNKYIRPDIVVTKNSKKVIIDTKWKIINDNKPGDDDLKQMFVYNLLWDAQKSFLVYPGDNNTCEGSYRHFELSQSRKNDGDEGFYNHCSLFFMNIIGEPGKNISNLPFEQLLNNL